MSTSPSPALAPDVSSSVLDVRPFPYETVPESAIRTGVASDLGFQRSPEAETAARETRALAQGRQEGLDQARQRFDEQLTKERASLASALAQFTRDRAVYFQKTEAEIVQLSLAIARKILHREAQVDPLLLAGIVRVALEQIDAATGVRLHIHPQRSADWRQYLAQHIDLADAPELVEDASQPLDQCALETSMGTAQVGLEVQFKEIEQGLMDMLAARPGDGS